MLKQKHANKLSDVFGINVFSNEIMKECIAKEIYEEFRTCANEGRPLSSFTVEVIANAMKAWAIEHGVTHFTHWFQPMTGITAEKHDSFISYTSDGSLVIVFSGKDLMKGEPDASSFPSGGLRSTFEARGYTVWDYTSPVFIRGNTLYIPTAFCSYTGEALDKKIPVLRSENALSKEVIRIIKLFKKNQSLSDKDKEDIIVPKRVFSMVGAEQEYFLVPNEICQQRKDILLTGRTLFGAKPSKGQELEDHYFGPIKDRVLSFMDELDVELWKLGIQAKTRHNEVAPSQHELASIFTKVNVAIDNNQLTMEMLQKLAYKHGFRCLLHEKPFQGVNGSGKHNNWSICTDYGKNLLDPGKTPGENRQFLLLLCAIIKAVDKYADLLRLSASNPGNDLRLGADEAPPAIISIYLGDFLTKILESLEVGEKNECGNKSNLDMGVNTISILAKDYTDRNRTSPFAFTGNKFEFRMVPSSISIAEPNYVLNTVVADVLSQVADRLEKTDDFDAELSILLSEIIRDHKKVIYNGNNYCSEWIQEAKERGLPNISSHVEAISCMLKEKNIEVFSNHGVLNYAELEARYGILLENYIKTINIEALTMIEIVKRDIIPAVLQYITDITNSVDNISSIGIDADVSTQTEMIIEISSEMKSLNKCVKTLEKVVKEVHESEFDMYKRACYYRDIVIDKMKKVRMHADDLETMVGSKYWPMPTYAELLLYA